MAGTAFSDWRQMGHAMRRRMGAPSNTLAAADAEARRVEDAKLLAEEQERESATPTFRGKRKNLRRMGGQ